MKDLIHFGTKRHSGRYPWGSGKNPQRTIDYISWDAKLKEKGLSEFERAETMGFKSTVGLRKQLANDKRDRKQLLVSTVRSMHEHDKTVAEIVAKTGLSRKTVVGYIEGKNRDSKQATETIKKAILKDIEAGSFVDVGKGVSQLLGVKDSDFKKALSELEDEGYVIHKVKFQTATGKGQDKVEHAVLTKGTTEWKEVITSQNKVKPPAVDVDFNTGDVKLINAPKIVNPNRVSIKYAENGGQEMDGVIQLRRGVKDLDMGNAGYAQVRIKVGNDLYLKGMAIYSDGIPDGADIVFNTNKTKGTPMEKVLKPLDKGAANEFGATITRQSGAINIVREEGQWSDWGVKLSPQFLAKQPLSLVKERLGETQQAKLKELEEIMALTNPTLKRTMLEKYAEATDTAAYEMKALPVPKTMTNVILPIPSLKENEIYAPNYNNGDRVALVRFPHAGRFEIPELIVNNRDPKAKSMLNKPLDAVGINPKVAEKLSGADFDGDTVLTILNNNGKIKSEPMLKALDGFDPKKLYKLPDTMPTITKHTGQKEMGAVSNLITDMTIKGANSDEIAKAVSHSMTVIDAIKHRLDIKLSENENGIAALSKKYQTGGASTLLSRSKQTQRLDQIELNRGGKIPYNPDTGRLIFKTVANPRTYVDKNGKTKTATSDVKKILYLGDANKLSSGTNVETVYANFSNNMMRLAATARKEINKTKEIEYNKEIAKNYKEETKTIKEKVAYSKSKKPLERYAQNTAVSHYRNEIRNSKEEKTKEEIKKLKDQSIKTARIQIGSKKERIAISDREWEAIQNGAISKTLLKQLLDVVDTEQLVSLATPRTQTAVSNSAIARALALLEAGLTYAEVAQRLGTSTTIIGKIKRGEYKNG